MSGLDAARGRDLFGLDTDQGSNLSGTWVCQGP